MLSDVTTRALAARLADEQRRERVPSLVAGLVRDGRLVWCEGRGDIRGDASGTQYRIGSITKTLVAVCVMRLRDEGLVDLAAPASRYVPDAPLGDATVLQLLSHAAGMRAETPGPWWERSQGTSWAVLAQGLAADPAAAPPGRRFHYSNVGYAVLGELVARLRGAAWHAVVARELLAPLEMRRTTTRPEAPYAPGLAVHPWADAVLAEPEHDAGAMGPAGQLWSTVADMARWASFLAGDTADVLAADTLVEMRHPVVVDDRPGEPWTGAYGLGVQVWNVDGRRTFGHGGSMPGFVAGVQVDAESRDAVVVLANSTNGFSRSLPADLLELLRAEPTTPEAWQPGAAAHLLELTGCWYWGPAPFILRAVGGDELDLRPVGEGRGSRFRRQGEDWVGLDGYYAGEVLRVVHDRQGVLRQLDVASFVFTRRPYDGDADVPGGVDPQGWR